MELRDTFEWRGLGWIDRSALKLRPEFADWDAEVRFELPGTRVEDPKACQCGEVLVGAIKPWECKVFGTACTPGTPDRHLHGLERGRLRRVLQLRAAREAARARPGMKRRHAAARRGRHARARRGRQGDACARRGAVPRGARQSAARPALRLGGARGERLAARLHDRLVRRQADLLPGRRHRRPGRQRHGQRPRGLGSAAARSLRGLRDRGGLPDRRPAPDRRLDGTGCGARGCVGRGGRHQGGRARQGRRRLRHDGRRRRRRPRGRARPRARAARRPRARLRHDRRPRHGGDGRPRRAAAGGRPGERHRAACSSWRRRC